MKPRFYAAAHAAVAAAGMLPLLVAFPAPLQDWPNHLAGAAVADALLRGDPFWLRFYRLGTFLVPDAALGLGLLALQRLGLGVPAAGAVFLCVTYAVFVGGMLALARALRAPGPEKVLLAVLLFYGAALFWGLAGYVLGVGVLMLLLALSLSVRGVGARAVVGVAGAAALALVHPVPAVVFVVVLGCLALPRLRALEWREALAVLAAAAGLLCMLRLLPGHGPGDYGLRYAGRTPVWVVLWKVRVLVAALLGGPLWQDGLSLLAALCCLGAPLALARCRLTPQAWLALAGTMLLTLAAPERLGSGSLLDVRLAILPLLVLAFGTQVQWRTTRARHIGLATMGGAVLARTVAIGVAWRQAGAVFAAFHAAARAVPAGSLLMMGYGTNPSTLTWQQIWTPPILSLGAGVAQQGVFFPALFANPSQQPIVLLPQWRGWALPWNLEDPAHRAAAARRIAPLCDGGFAGVFVTVLYPGDVAASEQAATLAAQRQFALLDACRLGR